MSGYTLLARRPEGRGERGQSLVELAIVLPILLALLVGIFEMGRAWNVYQVLTNAAREGARAAVIPTNAESDVRTTIESYLADAALDPALGTITITGQGNGVGTPSQVEIEYPYEFAFLGPVVSLLGESSTVPGAISLSTAVTMRNE
ncbi:MAG: pilus assembly protein [Gemmatimonadetes bacterium]|nr:pilus assembly protein [Gemmatimonadota bacterium]